MRINNVIGNLLSVALGIGLEVLAVGIWDHKIEIIGPAILGLLIAGTFRLCLYNDYGC